MPCPLQHPLRPLLLDGSAQRDAFRYTHVTQLYSREMGPERAKFSPRDTQRIEFLEGWGTEVRATAFSKTGSEARVRRWAGARLTPFTVNTRNATSAGPLLILHAPPPITGVSLPKALCRSWGHRVHNREQSHTFKPPRAQFHPHRSVLHHLGVQPFPQNPILTPPLVLLLLKPLPIPQSHP